MPEIGNIDIITTESSNQSEGTPDLVRDGDGGVDAGDMIELARSMFNECKDAGQLSTLETALYLLREVLTPRIASLLDDRRHLLKHLVLALVIKYVRTGHTMDLNEAMVRLQNDAQDPPGLMDASIENDTAEPQEFEVEHASADQAGDYEGGPTAMIDLAIGSLTEYCQEASLANLDGAIFLYREALSYDASIMDNPASMSSLADALLLRCLYSRQPQDLVETVLIFQIALSLQRPSVPDHPQLLWSLLAALLTKYCIEWQLDDLAWAIKLHTQASDGNVRVQDSLDMAGRGSAYLDKFFSSGDPMDLDLAADCFDEALKAMPAEHPARYGMMQSYAAALLTRFEHTGRGADLRDGIALSEGVLKLLSTTHPARADCLRNLANALSRRFERQGQIKDIEEAVSLNREALTLCPVPHPDRSESLNTLADALSKRFRSKHLMSDLEEAILLHREALTLLTSRHPNRFTCLHNFSNELMIRFHERHQAEDLEEAISLKRESLALLPDLHPDRLTVVNNFANILSSRFERYRRVEDLEEAIAIHRKSLPMMIQHPARSDSMSNLARALLLRFEQAARTEDIDEAISLYREALILRPAPHSGGLAALHRLADGLTRRFDQRGQLDDLEAVISLRREALTILPRYHPDRLSYLRSLESSLWTRFERSGQMNDLEESILQRREILQLCSSTHPDRHHSLKDLADALLAQLKRGGKTDLSEIILLQKEALALCPAPHPDRPLILNHLGNSMLRRFQQQNQVDDLDNAILIHREALPLFSTHPDRSSVLKSLASAHWLRYRENEQIVDLHEAIALNREVLVLLPPLDSSRPAILGNLAIHLWKRFQKLGHLKDLEETISLDRETLPLYPAPHPDRPRILITLSDSLLTRFDKLDLMDDLDEIIKLTREALSLLPALHVDCANALSALTGALLKRFDRQNRTDDLEDAISLFSEALAARPASHPDRPQMLNNFTNALVRRFQQYGRLNDLEEAIALSREALRLRSVPHPSRPVSLHSLAGCLVSRFKHGGTMSDLEEAIALYREALMLDHEPPDRSMILSDLAGSLAKRFEQSRQWNDLEEAILLHREAVLLRPAPHVDRPTSLSNLAGQLTRRFEQTGQMDDLEQAIALNRSALALCPAPHTARIIFLSNLATGLSILFEQHRQEVVLEEAILLNHEVLNLVPDPRHPDRSHCLNSLASALFMRFEQQQHVEDIDKAILLHREALALRPPPHSDRYNSLSNLATALLSRFKQQGLAHDLQESISLRREILVFVPASHPARCNHLLSLASSLMASSSRNQSPDIVDTAMDTFRSAVACESASVLDRLRAAQTWADNADTTEHASALEAYQAAIQLLPRVAMLSSDIQSRQRLLAQHLGSIGLARAAATCAIRFSKFERAVEMLEEGRAIFWSQALQLRTPLDDLRLADSRLADKLDAISHALEQNSLREVSHDIRNDAGKAMSMEVEAVRFRQLNEDWLTTLKQIRNLQGFEQFLLPRRINSFRQAAAGGPVVILNASGSSCDALIITLAGVDHIQLSLTGQDTVHLANSLRNVILSGFMSLTQELKNTLQIIIQKAQSHRGSLSSGQGTNEVTGQDRSGRRKRQEAIQSPDDVFRGVLASLWSLVVEPIVHHLKLERSKTPPRLWWCPTGPFAFLPLHAAGRYDANVGRIEIASDYIVSSYTPTLNMLLVPPPTPNPDLFKMLLVIQPETEGHNPLPSTREEMHRIERHVPTSSLIELGGSDVPSSVLAASEHLPDVSIAHFACHGTQDVDNPLESALLLGDGPLKVSTIMKQPLPNASLAFLSACQTGMGDVKLPDEAMHLAATMLYSGFRGVVATMWSILDVDGPEIADSFYGHLFQQDGNDACPDTTRAAQALHLAVTKLRIESNNRSFQRWVPFVHFGL